jgi:hypothetical protein
MLHYSPSVLWATRVQRLVTFSVVNAEDPLSDGRVGRMPVSYGYNPCSIADLNLVETADADVYPLLASRDAGVQGRRFPSHHYIDSAIMAIFKLTSTLPLAYYPFAYPSNIFLLSPRRVFAASKIDQRSELGANCKFSSVAVSGIMLTLYPAEIRSS